LKAILQVILKVGELEEENKIQKLKNKRVFLREIAKYINLVGGVTVWDRLNEKEAYDKTWHFVESQIKYIQDVKV